MMTKSFWSLVALSLGLSAALGILPARAQSVADFYKNKTVTLIISSSAGGGYDALGRAVARYLPKHIPGSPAVVVRNMPGAGGIVATNFLFNNAPKDGTVIGGVQNNTPFEPLFGTKEAKYDALKFNWLGSPSYETAILIVWHTAPVKTIEEARSREITVASSGANSTPSFYSRLLNETLGTKLKIVVGYPGQNEAFFAMERGEIDGYPSIFYSSLQSTKPTWLKEGMVRPLVQYGPGKEPEIGNVPFALDLIKEPDDKLLMDAAFAPLAVGRPYLMPPDVPEDRVAAMRKALDDTFNDPEFLALATQMNLGVNQPQTGQEIHELIRKAYDMPPKVIERLRKLQQPE